MNVRKLLAQAGFILLASICIQGCSTIGSARVDNGQTAMIQDINGEAEMVLDEGEWQPAHSGVKLRAGDKIRTRENSTATLDLGENAGSVQLQPESQLKIQQIGSDPNHADLNAVLELEKGRIIGDTKSPPKHGKVMVRTPRGTFEVH